MTKLLKIASVAILAVLVLVGCEPPKDTGKSGKPTSKVIVWGDGEHSIGSRNVLKTIKALDPDPSCSWTLMYDLPNGKVVVVKKGGAKGAKSGVKLRGPGTLRYRDPKTGKMVEKKDRPTSFYSENCNTWSS